MLRSILTCFFILPIVCSFQLQATNYFQKLSKFTTEHGIVNNTIYSIFQDSTGGMWFGTLEGLSSYNGLVFSSYPMTDSEMGYPITLIDQLSKDQLLLGTSNGSYLFSISNKEYQKIDIPGDFSMLTALFKIHNRSYLSTKSGIYEWDDQNRIGMKRFDHSITCKQLFPNGDLLLGTAGSGVWQAELNSDSLLVLNKSYPELQHESVKAISFLKEGEPVILTENALWMMQEEKLVPVIEGSFSSMNISQHNEILLGTFGEFIQQIYKEGDRYTLKDYINRDNEIFNDFYDAQINVLFKDHSGSVWIGTNRAGLDRIDRKKITYKKYESDIQDREPEAGYINALFQNEKGRVWVGTSGKGLYYLDREKQCLTPTPIFPGNLNDLYVEAILQHKDKLYVGTRHMGIITASVVAGENTQVVASGQLFSKEAGLAKNDYIYALKHYNEKLYICSSKGTFVYGFDNNNFSKLDSVSSINFALDSLDNQWILSYRMELYFNQQKLEFGTEVSDFHIGNNGEVWLATGKGVAFLPNVNAKPLFYNPAKKVIEFTSIRRDKDGYFWLGSRMGIYRFDPQSKLFASYQITGGSKANSFNHAKLLEGLEGEFYWGSNDGVVSINPQACSYLPKPMFEVEQGKKEEASIFNVYNFSYNHQEENGLAYRFFHPDSSWNYLPGDKAVLDFSHLDRGSYQLDIAAINADGIMNDKFKSFHFQIKRSLNATLSLWGIILIALAGIVFWYWKGRKADLASIVEEKEQPETPEDKVYREWTQDEFMQRALIVIEENLSDNSFGVNELYLAIQMSKSNFYRKLKKFTDLSPNELIRFVRLRKSAQLLIEAKQSVNEIAYEVGFNSPSYFTRCFKQQFGIAPSEYKEHYNTLCCAPEKAL
ncbi:helix-turn-helix domain-containing protein [Marinifilum sp. D714]|uniref:helix-turn-helix domain-containing protein n=1 Tax=Marinifilum sp. D714 TaxID=2937523 RepID=UPI0027C45F0B|nr:helix-turn-helix domain-containing protein [Marinifilum sp. D714]MDQ2180125.1 helix-turn-helix domain-containing protein [Marinifilum sp. D714]